MQNAKWENPAPKQSLNGNMLYVFVCQCYTITVLENATLIGIGLVNQLYMLTAYSFELDAKVTLIHVS